MGEQSPVALGRIFAKSSANVTINTDLFATDLDTPNLTDDREGTIRVTVILAAAAKFKAVFKNGGTSNPGTLNKDVALVAGTLYTFPFACRSGDNINFWVDTKVGIDLLYVSALVGEVGLPQ